MRLTYRVFLYFAVLLLPLAAQARCASIDLRQSLSPTVRIALEYKLAKIPFSTGIFWRADKDGREIHIVGTVHTNDPRLRQIMYRIRGPLLKADLVLLEVTSAQIEAGIDPAVQKALTTLPRNQSLPQLLGPKDWELLSKKLTQLQLHPASLHNVQPWALSDVLVDHEGCKQPKWGSWKATNKQRGLDDRIERRAQRRNIPVASLETTADGLRALSSVPLPYQIQILRMELHSQTNDANLTRTLNEAYFDQRFSEGRIVADWTLYQDTDIPRHEVHRLLSAQSKPLLDHRTRAWMTQIRRKNVQRLFIAVGAAHLSGQNGLLSLLQQDGWSISPMPK